MTEHHFPITKHEFAFWIDQGNLPVAKLRELHGDQWHRLYEVEHEGDEHDGTSETFMVFAWADGMCGEVKMKFSEYLVLLGILAPAVRSRYYEGFRVTFSYHPPGTDSMGPVRATWSRRDIEQTFSRLVVDDAIFSQTASLRDQVLKSALAEADPAKLDAALKVLRG